MLCDAYLRVRLQRTQREGHLEAGTTGINTLKQDPPPMSLTAIANPAQETIRKHERGELDENGSVIVQAGDLKQD